MNEEDTKESPRNEPELDLDGDSDDPFGDSHDLEAEDLEEILDGIKVDSETGDSHSSSNTIYN